MSIVLLIGTIKLEIEHSIGFIHRMYNMSSSEIEERIFGNKSLHCKYAFVNSLIFKNMLSILVHIDKTLNSNTENNLNEISLEVYKISKHTIHYFHKIH